MIKGDDKIWDEFKADILPGEYLFDQVDGRTLVSVGVMVHLVDVYKPEELTEFATSTDTCFGAKPLFVFEGKHDEFCAYLDENQNWRKLIDRMHSWPETLGKFVEPDHDDPNDTGFREFDTPSDMVFYVRGPGAEVYKLQKG